MVFPKTVEHVVVVSGGPSASKTYFEFGSKRGAAFVERYSPGLFTAIGVNHVVEKGHFDYWVTCDHMVFETANPKGQPILFGHSDWNQRIAVGPYLNAWCAWPKIFQGDVHKWMPPPVGDVPTYKDAPLPCAQWNAFSGVAALGLAWILRPKEVDLFGFDMEGEGGAADEGHDLPRNRTTKRWLMEGEIFRWWLRSFDEADIIVRWHTSSGIETWA